MNIGLVSPAGSATNVALRGVGEEYGHNPWLRHVVLVRSAGQRPLSRTLELQLELRNLPVVEMEPRPDWSPRLGDVPVVLFSASQRGGTNARLWQVVDRCGACGIPAVVVLPGNRPIGAEHERSVAGVVRVDRADAPAPRVFSELLALLLGPLPYWLRCYVDPTRIHAPSGVTWWTDELLVADEHFGHVVKAGVASAATVVPGLETPHHIHLDREKLLIANRGAHEILLAELGGGAARIVTSLRNAAGESLRHPNGVQQAEGVTVVADTDHHRVLVARHDVFARVRGAWRPVRAPGSLRYPTGVCADDSHVFVADTHRHRVLAFDHEGQCLAEAGRYGFKPGQFAYPVGMVRWRDLLIVADEEGGRLQAFRLRDSGSRLRLTPVAELYRLGYPWIGKPFALSVNVHEQLAVSDRLRRCIWKIDLPRVATLVAETRS